MPQRLAAVAARSLPTSARPVPGLGAVWAATSPPSCWPWRRAFRRAPSGFSGRASPLALETLVVRRRDASRGASTRRGAVGGDGAWRLRRDSPTAGRSTQLGVAAVAADAGAARRLQSRPPVHRDPRPATGALPVDLGRSTSTGVDEALTLRGETPRHSPPPGGERAGHC